MKKGSFTGQLYREFYLARKSYITGLIMFAAWALFGCLALVSFRYGNIGKIIDHLAADSSGNADPAMFDYEGMRKNIESALFVWLKGFPSLMTLSFIFSGADIAGKDELSIWQRYAKCTPITPARRSALKMLMNCIAAAAAFILSVCYFSFIDALTGTTIGYTELAVLVTSITAITLMSVIAQIYIRIFRGMDKGMLALVVTVIVVEFAIFTFNSPGPGAQEKEIDLVGLCEQLFPFTPIIFIGTLAVGFAAMYVLYGRREK